MRPCSSRLSLRRRASPAQPDRSDAHSYRVNIPTAKSEYISLTNMFNPAEETEPGWDRDLRDDVKTECQNKYGDVADIFLDRENTEGQILVKFRNQDGADRAVEGLNGRFLCA